MNSETFLPAHSQPQPEGRDDPVASTGFHRRFRSRRVAVAAAGVSAVVVATAVIATPTETIAAFTDDVWAGAGFSASKFGVEISLINSDEEYGDHPEGDPLILKEEATGGGFTFDPPVKLIPGEVTYAGFYIRRTPGTEDHAKITMSPPSQGTGTSATLWSGYLTYSAHYAPLAGAGTTKCENMDLTPRPQGWRDLHATTTFANAPGFNPTFTVGEGITTADDGDPLLVCFRFELDSGIVTLAPSANGESVYPTWTFTADSVPAT